MKHLTNLEELRSRALEQRQAALAERQQLQARVAGTIERLDSLVSGISAGGACAAQALNGAVYKQALLTLADGQRRELAQCEAQVGQARQALVEAARQREVIAQLLQQSREREQLARSRQEQKRQDELATQSWLRQGAVR